jgi:hypothetical protein
MTFGNLLNASAERNPRRAAIVLEKESISHVLRPHAAPYRNSSATPSPRPATGIERARSSLPDSFEYLVIQPERHCLSAASSVTTSRASHY